MATHASIREALHDAVDVLPEPQLEILMDYVNNLRDPDSLSPEEEVRATGMLKAMESGDYVTFEEMLARPVTRA